MLCRKLLRFFYIQHNPTLDKEWRLLYQIYRDIDKRELPILFKLLDSGKEDIVNVTRKVLQNYTCLFTLDDPQLDGFVSLEDLEFDCASPPPSGNPPPWRVGQGYRIDLDDVMAFTDLQLLTYFPIIVVHLMTQLSQDDHIFRNDCVPILKQLSLKSWTALLHRVHKDPYLSQNFYWLAQSYHIFTDLIGSASIQLFLASNELHTTQNFFDEIYNNWENIQPGHCYPTQILDPLSLTCEKVIQVTVIKRFVSKAQPLLFEFTYESGQTRKIICKKGI